MEENKCYCLGALQVPFNQMKNPTNPEELAYIFNKKHKQHMDDHLFHLIRSNTMAPTPVYADYLNNTTDLSQILKISSNVVRRFNVATPAKTLDKNMAIMG